MNKIAYSKFNERPQYYLDEIVKTKQDTMIVKNGKPYIKIYPVMGNKIKNPLKNSIIFENDIISPINVEWESNS